MKPHLEVPREGETCLPLGGAELCDACWVWGLAPPPFMLGFVLSPFNSRALELLVWFVRSGEEPSLVLKWFYMNTRQLFPLWRCSCWSDLLRSAVSAEETLGVWCQVRDVGSQASHRRTGAVFECSHSLSFQEKSCEAVIMSLWCHFMLCSAWDSGVLGVVGSLTCCLSS